jgi:hypothetical protein
LVVHLATSLHLAAHVMPRRPISSYLPARSSSFRLAFRPALVLDGCARRARDCMLAETLSSAFLHQFFVTPAQIVVALLNFVGVPHCTGGVVLFLTYRS